MGEERKTVLFIVEGPSDKSALEKIFKKIYKRNRNIDFKFTDGDISVKRRIMGGGSRELFSEISPPVRRSQF